MSEGGDAEEATVDVDAFVASLHRLEQTVAARNMPVLAEQLEDMNPPATDEDIDRANEAVAPFRLPLWLEALYRWHNGSGYRGLDLHQSHLRFLPLKEAVDQYNHLSAGWNGFGLYRKWSWPIVMADSDVLIATLDYGNHPTEPILTDFDMVDEPFALWESPEAWIKGFTEMYELVEESVPDNNITEDGYIDWHRQLKAAGKDFKTGSAISKAEFALRVSRWPESLLYRAGIAELLVDASELPAMLERRLRKDEGIPHPGPWNFYFGDLAPEWYDSPPVSLPAEATLRSEWKGEFGTPIAEVVLNVIVPKGILPDHALVHGLDVDVVVWFDPETLADQAPTIQRIAYPR